VKIPARMHTAEHLLTAVMNRLFGSPRNLEVHLGTKKTKCDYTVPRALTGQDIKTIEEAVNTEIERDHPVIAETLPLDQATGYDLWKVPKDAQIVRIVRIGNFDATPCSGDHVTGTRKLGSFRVTSFTMKDPHTVRIRFTLDEQR
jgi:misacylated tRNA(Ala) deacylase